MIKKFLHGLDIPLDIFYLIPLSTQYDFQRLEFYKNKFITLKLYNFKTLKLYDFDHNMKRIRLNYKFS